MNQNNNLNPNYESESDSDYYNNEPTSIYNDLIKENEQYPIENMTLIIKYISDTKWSVICNITINYSHEIASLKMEKYGLAYFVQNTNDFTEYSLELVNSIFYNIDVDKNMVIRTDIPCIDSVKKLVYPPNIKSLWYKFDINNRLKKQKNNSNIVMNMSNLPTKLKRLTITSDKFLSIILDNLPDTLEYLDLSYLYSSEPVNLNFLPENLKVLKLNLDNDDDDRYKKSDLSNLPTGLTKIYIGTQLFNCVSQILESKYIKN